MVKKICLLLIMGSLTGTLAGLRGAVAAAKGGDRRSELVSSISVSGAAYLAVLSDKNGDNTTREFGFYSRDKSGGEWRPVTYGKIIPSQIGPILEEFQIAKTSKRFEAIAIVDGVLKVFNVNSSPEDRNSIIELGQGQYMLFDHLTGMNVPLPKIKSSSDVQIFAPDMALGQDHQLVIVSIRNPDLPVEDGGYTFAFLLKVKHSTDSAMELENPPVLLDYSFHKAQDLRSLIVTNDKNQPLGVVSQMYINSISQPNKEDPRFLRDWKARLKKYVEGEESVKSPPYYDLVNHEVTLSEAPTMTVVDTSNLILKQEINVATGQDVVRVLQGNSKRVKFFGRLDVNEDTGEPLYRLLDDRSHLFYFMNGDLYYVPLGQGADPIKLIAFSGELPQKISYSAIKVINSGDQPLFYVTVSYRLQSEEETTRYFKMSAPSNTSLYMHSTGTLTDLFYEEYELRHRLIDYSQDDGLVLFDYKTQRQENEQVYQQAYREKARHYNLTTANGDLVETKFVVPKFESIIKVDEIFFREFEEDEEDREESSSGIYVYGRNGRQVAFVPGQILANPETKDMIWSQATAQAKGKGEFELTSVFIDASWNKGQYGGRQHIVVTDTSSDGFASGVIPIKMDLPIENIVFTKVVPGLKSSGFFSIVTAFREEGDINLRIDSFSLESLGQGKPPKVMELGSYPINGEAVMTEKNLIERIVYSDLGIPFWIVNAEYDLEDPRIKLRSFANQEIIEPNGENKDPARVYKTWWDAHQNPNDMRERHISEPYKLKVHKNHLSSTPTMKNILEKKTGVVRTDLFPHLVRMLNRISDSRSPAVHQVLVVPNDLKPHIEQLVLSRFLEAQGPGETWSRKNKEMELFLFAENKPNSQSHLLQQIRVLPEVSGRQRAVIYADASRVINVGRIEDGAGQDSTFLIPDSSMDVDDSSTALDEAEVKMTHPHALYFLATEGKKIELSKFKKREGLQPKTSLLILASEKEWEALSKDVEKTEGAFGLLEHFEIERLSPPSREDQIRMFNEVTFGRAFRTLDYVFDAEKIAHDNEKLSAEEKKVRVISYLVTQVDTLAKEQKVNPLMAFSDVLVSFRNMLHYDDGIRRRGIIDYKTVQLVLAKVFKMPFKLQLLEETDPLKILSRGDILSLIQNIGGYPGDFSLTKQVVETILGQTRQETSKSMPASIVSFGETSTGKTQLFLSLVKTMDVMSNGNFKLYNLNIDPLDEHNLHAKAFILPCMKLTDSDSSGGLINVDMALSHLEHFLSSHNGYRGWILVDDLHYCAPSVRAKVISRLRSLFDTEDERVHVKSSFDPSAEMVSFPVRNLVHFLNFNPTIDQDKIRKYVGDIKYSSADPKKLAVASLADEGVQIDLSYFNRYSLFLNMDTFPASAKGPGLINKITSQLRDFYGDGHFVAISPTLIEKIVKQFENVDARNFISGAINGIALHVQDRIRNAKGSFYIVVPAGNCYGQDCEYHKPDKSDLKSEAPIIDFIGKHSVVLAVDEKVEGQLHFLNLIVDSFREQVIEGAVQAVRSSNEFSGTENLRIYIKSYFEQAALDHITEKSSLPLSAIPMDPAKFGMTSALEMMSFDQTVRDISGSDEKYFPEIFAHRVQRGSSLFSKFVDHEVRGGIQDSRAMVNTDYVERVRMVLLEYLEAKLKIDSIDSLPDVSTWLNMLQEETNGEEESNPSLVTPLTIGRKLSTLLNQYMVDINRRELVEKRSRDEFVKMSEYDAFRMFMFVMDKAIAKLPWQPSMQFLLKNIDVATKSMDLGGMSGVQEYLFSRDSLIRPTTGDHLKQVLLNSKDRADLDQDVVKRINERFGNECDRMLAAPNVNPVNRRGEE